MAFDWLTISFDLHDNKKTKKPPGGGRETKNQPPFWTGGLGRFRKFGGCCARAVTGVWGVNGLLKWKTLIWKYVCCQRQPILKHQMSSIHNYFKMLLKTKKSNEGSAAIWFSTLKLAIFTGDTFLIVTATMWFRSVTVKQNSYHLNHFIIRDLWANSWMKRWSIRKALWGSFWKAFCTTSLWSFFFYIFFANLVCHPFPSDF